MHNRIKLPFVVIPAEDESPSSWLIRLSRKHYCNTKAFCDFYGIESILKSPLDIKFDSEIIHKQFNLQIQVPLALSDKINSFRWERSRSAWLIDPNRKGQATLCSYTKVCVKCLKKKGYYQLKWKLNLFSACANCQHYLISVCPKCKREISPLLADSRFSLESDLNPLFHCWYCEYDLRKGKATKIKIEEIDLLLKINRAYSESPLNLRYLTFLQFGIIEGVSNHKTQVSDY